MNVQSYNINLRVGTGITQNVKISQGDVGRELVFYLYDGAVRFSPPSGATVKIKGTKPSGLGFDVTCTLSGSVARVFTTLAMTQEGGNIPAELEITNGNTVIGTANFMIYAEPSPHPDGTTDGTHATADNLQTQIGNLANLATTEKTNLVSAINEAAQSGGVVIDDTLTQTGAAADSKKTGDEIASLKDDLDGLDDRVEALESGSGGSGLTDTVKTALMNLVNHLAWDDDDPSGQSYITDLYNALYPPADLVSISAVYTQSSAIYETDALDDLKDDLVVTALMSDQTTRAVNEYTLSGTLTEGTSTITVSYGGKTTTFTVTVSQYDGSIYNWDFTQSLVDSKQGATATLGSGVTRGASGLTFDGTTNAYVHLADMSNYATSSFTVEVDVDTLVSGGTLIDLNTQSGMSDNPCGLIFSGHWYFRLTSNSNATLADSTLTDPTIFNGHTVKCQFDYANKLWTVYNNGTLVGSVTAYQKSNGRNQLGLSANYSSRYVGNGTVIKAVRVYEGVV